MLKCHENSKRRPQRPHASGHSFFQGLGSTISHPEAKTPRSHRSRANSEPKEHGVLLRQFGATVHIDVFPGLPGRTFMRSGFFCWITQSTIDQLEHATSSSSSSLWPKHQSSQACPFNHRFPCFSHIVNICVKHIINEYTGANFSSVADSWVVGKRAIRKDTYE